MRSGRRRARASALALGAAAALLRFGLGSQAGAAEALPASPPASGPVAALRSCANADLPAGILDGDFSGSASPLPTIEARGASVPLVLAVAADPASRATGLMCVTRLRAHRGMIFVFPSSAVQEFWMKDTLVPLDMVWVGSEGSVTHVAAAVPASTLETPDDRVARRTGEGRFVIELPSGEARRDGIVAGLKFSLPDLRARE
jgi:uncharacterized membrane protein (UPF0127 family)